MSNRSNQISFAGAESRRAWAFAGSVAAVIFFASSFGRVAGPEIAGIDKVAHFFVYGLLATLFVRTPQLRQRGALGGVWAVALTTAYGLTDEIHQHFVPGRASDSGDLLVDTLGAALAVFMYRVWPHYHWILEFDGRKTTAPITRTVRISQEIS